MFPYTHRFDCIILGLRWNLDTSESAALHSLSFGVLSTTTRRCHCLGNISAGLVYNSIKPRRFVSFVHSAKFRQRFRIVCYILFVLSTKQHLGKISTSATLDHRFSLANLWWMLYSFHLSLFFGGYDLVNLRDWSMGFL
jgi:hypothetical protein